MVLGIQIAGLLIGMFLIYYDFLVYKRKEFTAKEFVFWVVLWLGFILVTLFPSILEPVVKSFGFFRVLDAFLIGGLLFLMVIIFYTYIITKKKQKQVEAIVREIALSKRKGK